MTRPLTGDEPLDQRTQLMMSRSDLVAIDDWRFARRIGSRSEAIRQLIALGLGSGQPAHMVAALGPAEEGVFEAAKRQGRGG